MLVVIPTSQKVAPGRRWTGRSRGKRGALWRCGPSIGCVRLGENSYSEKARVLLRRDARRDPSAVPEVAKGRPPRKRKEGRERADHRCEFSKFWVRHDSTYTLPWSGEKVRSVRDIYYCSHPGCFKTHSVPVEHVMELRHSFTTADGQELATFVCACGNQLTVAPGSAPRCPDKR